MAFPMSMTWRQGCRYEKREAGERVNMETLWCLSLEGHSSYQIRALPLEPHFTLLMLVFSL